MRNEKKEFKKKQYFKNLHRKINLIKNDYIEISDEILRDLMNENGEAIINVIINDYSDLYHEFSKKSEINPEIYDYIESIVYPISASVPIKIVIHTIELPQNEQINIKRLIQNHYVLALCDKQQDYEINMLKGIMLSAAGFILMMLYVALDRISAGTLVMEIASIAATFALWEAVDCFALESRELSINRLNAGQLATAEIEFN